jgi:hypothetical protein
MRRAVRLTALVAAATLAAGALGAGKALAYGHSDQPVAQVEISGNCDNPSFWFCADVVGTGGIWAWAELNNVASSAVPGWNEMDATVADCGHTVGGGGPGSAGAGGGPDQIGIWQEFSSLTAAEIATGGAAAPLLIPLGSGSAYSGSVYVLDFFPGTGSEDFEVVVPAGQGHYSASPAPGVSLQIQVAP